MRIVCVGGGPAGLYLSILMKIASPHNDVSVFERRTADTPDGWGVVFWDDLLDDLRASDSETARRIAQCAFEWHGQLLDLEGDRTEHEGGGYGIRRSTLLDILTARALELGVVVRFDQPIVDDASFSDADVVVASDGAPSTMRQRAADEYGTRVVLGRNKYVWLGTPKLFDPFTFAFVSTHAGWVWCHAYTFDEQTSTFIVECAPETWEGLGFPTLCARESLARLETIFARQLEGAALMNLGRDEGPLPWLSFRTITNERWHSGRTVLIGDAAHTTHFSIGSGTRLALQDAIALAAALDALPTPQAAFAAYEQVRRGALLRPQAEASASASWFEHVPRYADLPSREFFVLLRARRDPLLPRIPTKLYYRLYVAFERVSFLRSLRSWLGPKVRTIYGRARRASVSRTERHSERSAP